jgi:shikimate kinase
MARIFLTGYMGSGKTTVGKKLANQLDLKFIDLDTRIEEESGKSIQELFDTIGEDLFRKKESDVLRSVCELDDIVLATGGGTPCFFDNQELMNRSGITIYLKLHPGSIYYRLARSKTERPLVKSMDDATLMEYILSSMLEREPYYKKAQITIKGESVDLVDLKEKVLQELEGAS